jgi:hypothetical protein
MKRGWKGMRTIPTTGTIFVFFCLVAIFFATGCATIKKIAGDITGKRAPLKKKIVLLHPSDKTGYGHEALQKSSGAYFISFAERSCDDIIVIDSQEIRDLLAQIPLLPSGQIDNLALAELGRALGLNVALELSFSDFECVAEKRGIWGFRDMRTIVRLSVSVRGYDIGNGAVLFEEAVEKEVEASGHDCQSIKDSGGYPEGLADGLLAKAMPELSERVCERVGDEPWRGYITAVSDDTFTITAGKDVGLAKGDLLDVFGMSETIEGHGDQTYLIPGPKVGELQITRVQRNWAEATGSLEGDLQKTSHVELKP